LRKRASDEAIHLSDRHSGRREAAISDVQLHIVNLEIPGSMLRIAPE
jgi:hypothetical protein